MLGYNMYISRTNRTRRKDTIDRVEMIIENAVLLFVEIRKRLHKM